MRHTTIVRATLLTIFLAGSASLRAQDAAIYSRAAGDTLRYRNVTKMEGMVHGAAGDAPFSLSRDATVAFAFTGGESITAWYERIAIDASGALGGNKLNSDALLHALFQLKMEPNGRVITLKSPDLPRSARLIAELPPQLDDFFPRLPAMGTIPVGKTWTDTATRNESDSAGHRLSIRRISHYVVTGDTLVGGKTASVIAQHTEVRITSSMPMRQQPYVTDLSLTGEEDGTALFGLSQGLLLSRERKGELRGSLTYKGGDEPWVVNQNYHYRRTDVLETDSGRP